MLYSLLIPILMTFFISVLLGPVIIPFLRKLKVKQTERKELESHLKKAGTPTMGGFIFIIAVCITSFFYMKDYPKIVPVLCMFLAFGAIGFIDDYLKVVLKRSDGLKARQKMILQIIVTIIFAIYMIKFSDINMEVRIPFWHNHLLSIGWLAIPLLFIAVLGTTNGTNLTDGIDGLLSTVTLPVALFLALASIHFKSGIEPFSLALIGGLLAFLVFNSYPAKVFMGDTGSLAIGGYVVASAYMMNMPIFIIIFGLIYLIEVLSVMIQVTYFKKTKGKRIFRMAPIHHHFELGGWSETKVVAIFSITTTILCMIAALAL